MPVLSRLDRGMQSAMEMLPLQRGRVVAHSFNCNFVFVDMRLADALVEYFAKLIKVIQGYLK